MKIGMLGTQANPLTGAIAPELAGLLAADVSLAAYPSRAPLFPYTELDRAMQVLGHIEAGLRAQADGCDAVVLDTFGDYGLAVLKASLNIPVVGCGEASLHQALTLARRFSVVTVWPESMNFITHSRLIDCGALSACASLRNVGGESDLADLEAPGGYLSQIAAGATGIVSRVVEACQAAVRDDGAEVVVLGCTCMSPIAQTVAERCDFPVLNPRALGFSAAVQLAGQAPRPHPAAVRPASLEALTRMLDAVAQTPAEDCPVCVSLDPFSEIPSSQDA